MKKATYGLDLNKDDFQAMFQAVKDISSSTGTASTGANNPHLNAGVGKLLAGIRETTAVSTSQYTTPNYRSLNNDDLHALIAKIDSLWKDRFYAKSVGEIADFHAELAKLTPEVIAHLKDYRVALQALEAKDIKSTHQLERVQSQLHNARDQLQNQRDLNVNLDKQLQIEKDKHSATAKQNEALAEELKAARLQLELYEVTNSSNTGNW